MATGQREQQVSGVERDVAFLKQEHVVMLTGLHLEITQLRRRCNELGAELNSQFPNRTSEVEEVLAARCADVRRRVEGQQCMMVHVRGELRLGRARHSALGRSLKDEEQRFLEELKRRSHRITSLSRHLERQTVTAATLCQELHSARRKLHQQNQTTEDTVEERGGEGEEEEVGGGEEEEEEDDEDWLLSPPPPISPDQWERRRSGRGSVREERVRACVPLMRVTSPQRPRPMPDPALFLYPLRYRILPWNQPIRLREGEGEGAGAGAEQEWTDVGGRRVDMGAGEGETAL
ncbi:coiled-coil domain-containing 92B-like [Aplochiton taeniatus]